MKKRLVALGVAGLLVGGPSANAEINSSKDQVNNNLVDAFSTEKSEQEDSVKTISFEDAKSLQEHKKLIDSVLGNEQVQELIEEYGQENIERFINEIIINEINLNEDTKEIIETLLSDGKVQKAIEEGNEEELSKFIEEITKDFNTQSKWLRVIDKVCFGIIFVVVWENRKNLFK